MPRSKQPMFYKTGEVAHDFAVTRTTVVNWIKTGVLRGTKIGRDYRVLAEDVEALKARALAGEAMYE